MPATLSQIMVVPPTIPGVSGYVDTTVSITSATGASAVAYTTLDGSTAFTFPATVSSPTTFYLPYTGTFTVSALIGSQQVATTAYTAATVSAINSAAAVVVECAAPRDNQEELSSRFAPPSSLMMPGAISETIPRYLVGNTASLVSGKEHLTAIWLPSGAPVTTITYRSSGTAAANSTNVWFSLRDLSRNLLGVTSNDTAASPWSANTSKSLNLASSYVVPSNGWYYIGVMVSATTVPTLVGMATSATYQLLEPVLHGRDDTNAGLTTPATAPAISAALASASGGVTPWAWVS